MLEPFKIMSWNNFQESYWIGRPIKVYSRPPQTVAHEMDLVALLPCECCLLFCRDPLLQSTFMLAFFFASGIFPTGFAFRFPGMHSWLIWKLGAIRGNQDEVPRRNGKFHLHQGPIYWCILWSLHFRDHFRGHLCITTAYRNPDLSSRHVVNGSIKIPPA